MNLRNKKFLFSAAVWALCGIRGAQAQTQDISGNSMLKGTYQFRNVAVTNEDQDDNPTEVTATYGTITFDGNGNYTIAGTQVDNTVSSGAPQPYNAKGTYAIGSNGTGYVTNPLYPTDTTGLLYDYGAVSQGVFTGSATESGTSTVTTNGVLNDIFVAIPTGSVPTNASFTSSYQVGVLDFQDGDGTAILNALFKLNPNGSGGLGNISLNGQASNQDAETVTQSITGATYNFNNNGSATLTIPLPSGTSSANALFTGTKTIFESADGNFILGWNPNGYDIIFGVKAMSGATNSSSQGLYFTAALENAYFEWGTDSYYGSSYNTGDANGDEIIHQRLNNYNFYGPAAVDYGQDDQIQLNADGTTAASNYLGYEYSFGDAGLGFVAVGTNGVYSLVVGLHAGTFSGPGVYINPTMIYNSASYQPVTASLAPGELITLFGTGLASTTTAIQGGQPAPTSGLGNVSATIDGIPCPIFSVNQTGGPAGAPSFVSIIVPYGIVNNATIFANIQITNNGVKSNVVQMYFQDSAPGAFSQTENGLGFADVRDALSGALINQANPAKPAEYISVYMTGLGTVTPAINDGAVPPVSGPVSNSDEWSYGELVVYFNDYGPSFNASAGNTGNIQFAGLAPGLAALYQINVQVPSAGLGSGDDVELEFLTDTADVDQIYIPYGAGAATPAFKRTSEQRRASRAAHFAAVKARQRKPAQHGRGSKPVSGSSL